MVDEETLQMIIDCDKRKPKLSEWEQKFIDSIYQQLFKNPLTEKQIERLGKIWEKVT